MKSNETPQNNIVVENVEGKYAIKFAEAGDLFDLDGKGHYSVVSKIVRAGYYNGNDNISELSTELLLTRQGSPVYVLETAVEPATKALHFVGKNDVIQVPGQRRFVSYKGYSGRDHTELYACFMNLGYLNENSNLSTETEPSYSADDQLAPPTSEPPASPASFEPTDWRWLFKSEVMKFCRPGEVISAHTVTLKKFKVSGSRWLLEISAKIGDNSTILFEGEYAEPLVPYVKSGDELILSDSHYKVKGKYFKRSPSSHLYSIGLILEQA